LLLRSRLKKAHCPPSPAGVAAEVSGCIAPFDRISALQFNSPVKNFYSSDPGPARSNDGNRFSGTTKEHLLKGESHSRIHQVVCLLSSRRANVQALRGTAVSREKKKADLTESLKKEPPVERFSTGGLVRQIC
jgi:hypothetical protein